MRIAIGFMENNDANCDILGNSLFWIKNQRFWVLGLIMTLFYKKKTSLNMFSDFIVSWFLGN